MNRIRTPDEVAEVLVRVVRPVYSVGAYVSAIAGDRTTLGQATYAAMILCLFLITIYIDLLHLLVLIVNLLLLVPGIILHPRIWALGFVDFLEQLHDLASVAKRELLDPAIRTLKEYQFLRTFVISRLCDTTVGAFTVGIAALMALTSKK
jgi:hypothetical protein